MYSPEYWTTTTTVWLEFCQQTNIGVVIGFWGVLVPLLLPAVMNSPSFKADHGHYANTMKTHKLAHKIADNNVGMNDFIAWEIALNIYCHALPIIMIHINLYYSDIKL